MKALTINPFYVELITYGIKTIECRTWKTDYRGDILITSSAKKIHDTIPGHALAVAELYDIRRMCKDDAVSACMKPQDCTPDKYSWFLRNVRLIEPFAVNGKLSLWTYPDDSNIHTIITVDDLLKLQESDSEKYDAMCDHYWDSLYV